MKELLKRIFLVHKCVGCRKILDYDNFNEEDCIEIKGLADAVQNENSVILVNRTNGSVAKLCLHLSARQREMLLAGGCLNYTKMQR
jgi:aconitate hydratase